VEKYRCKTLELLQGAMIIVVEWKKLGVGCVRRLARSILRRCQAIIEARGDHTVTAHSIAFDPTADSEELLLMPVALDQ
jgi:hypothetical protein